jgi:hypothetical protein
MLARPARILSPPDIDDPDFQALCAAWTGQMRHEMQETIATTWDTIAKSRALMAEIDRMLALR